MKTDKKYSNNLKNGILTSEMLYNCIYSVNKRAKNNRDGKNYYRYSQYYHSYLEKMNEYYNMKDYLLKKFLKPKLIHKQKIENYYGKSFLYFLFYEMPQGTFHSPINENEIKKYKNLEIEKISDDFYTFGENFEGLASVQFVKKVIKLAKEDKLKYIEEN